MAPTSSQNQRYYLLGDGSGACDDEVALSVLALPLQLVPYREVEPDLRYSSQFKNNYSAEM